MNNAKSNSKFILFLVISEFLVIILNSLQPFLELYLVSAILDSIVGGNVTYALYDVLLLGVVTFVGRYAAKFMEVDSDKRIAIYSNEKYQMIFGGLMYLDYSDFEKGSMLKKIADARYTMDHAGGYKQLVLYERNLIESILKIFLALLSFFTVTWKKGYTLDSFIFGFSLLLVVIANFGLNEFVALKSKKKTLYGHEQKVRDERCLNYYSDEVFHNVSFRKDICMYNMEKLIIRKNRKAIDRFISYFNRYYIDVNRDKETFKICIHYFAMFLTYLFVISFSERGLITLGNIVRCVGTVNVLNMAVSSFSSNKALLELQKDFISTANEIMEKQSANYNTLLKKVHDINEIEFKNVSYISEESYKYIIKDVSFKISKGEHIAIVGANGAGKSTLVKLMCGLYKPSSGEILINGIDIKSIDLASYYQLIGTIFQDFKLFEGVISENISCGEMNDNARIASIMKSCGIGNFTERRDSLNISRLSGGEQQKVAIARALYKDADLMIMDEPTAAMDPRSEIEIFNIFNNISSEKTTVLISHRMGAIKSVQTIYVLNEGQIISKGCHDDLIKNCSIYKELYCAQAEMY